MLVLASVPHYCKEFFEFLLFHRLWETEHIQAIHISLPIGGPHFSEPFSLALQPLRCPNAAAVVTTVVVVVIVVAVATCSAAEGEARRVALQRILCLGVIGLPRRLSQV